MPLVQDEAIAIRRLDYSETSQVLAFFTREHGKQRLIAKGIKRGTKKRFATGIDLLERGRLVFSHRDDRTQGLGTLTEWAQEEVFAELRSDLRWMYAGQYVAEALDVATEENDPAPDLYASAVSTLHGLPTEAGVALAHFLRVLLTEIGLMPDLTCCVSCGRPWSGKTSPMFSAREGGLVCRECEGPLPEKRRVSAAVGRALLEDAIGPETAAGVFDLLEYHLTESLGRRLRMSAHVRGILFSCDAGR